MDTKNPLQGKVVWITGGSSGIGKAIAHTMVNNGAKVALCARRVDRLQSVAKDLQSQTPHVIYDSVDVASKSSVDAFCQKIIERWGTIDIVVNNAGLIRSGEIQSLSLEDWDLQYNVNLKGCFLVTKAALPSMLKQGQGRLIFISSTAALISPPGNACYVSTKWGLDGFVGCLAQEMVEYNIACHTVRPGYTETSIFDEDQHPDNPEIDWIQPEEIANAVDFLCRLPQHAHVPDLTYTNNYQMKKY